MLRANDVPDPGAEWAKHGALAIVSAVVCCTGVARHPAEPALVMGYHETQGTEAMDVFLPVQDPGHLQPVRCRLDGGLS